jgi:CO/xanthine dehydrogenase FAD-binding subunit
VLGGGTFLLNAFKKASCVPEDVISLRRVAALRGMKDEKECVTIGAMTAIAEIGAHRVVQKDLPSLAEACQRLGTTPLRHMATIGGNVARRFFWVDLPAVLLSLEARLVCQTPEEKKICSVDAFLQKKENTPFLLTHIEIPKKRPVAFYFRHTEAMPVDIAIATLVFGASVKKDRLADVRLVVNTTQAFPFLLKKTMLLFEAKPVAALLSQEIESAFDQDVGEAKLGDFKRRVLFADLQDLRQRLISGMKS